MDIILIGGVRYQKALMKKIYLKREEDSLKIKLENAVKMEEFEEAAIIRDKLKALRGGKLDSYEGGDLDE